MVSRKMHQYASNEVIMRDVLAIARDIAAGPLSNDR
jgi:hypothetical protein